MVMALLAEQRLRRWRLLIAAVAASTVVGSLARWGPDWPAQEFRALAARSVPFSLWNNNWFGGLPLAGYSVFYPILSGLVGASLTGVIACTAAAWAAGRLVHPESRAGDLLVDAAIVVSLVGSLLQGQLPFLLGTAFGLWALAFDRSGRPVLVAACAAMCSLSSPLSAAFLLLAAAATTAIRPVRRLVPYSAAFAGFGVAVVFQGAGGPEPYPWTSLAVVATFAVGVFVAFPTWSSQARVLRRLGFFYLAAALVLFQFANPIGGNIARLGWQLALPLACIAAQSRRTRRGATVICAAVLAVVWTVTPVAVSVVHGAHDPSQQRSYFVPLLRYFERARYTDAQRLEIPMTREHWESRWVAATIPLARGWERQTDVQYNQVLYHPLSAATYRKWLDSNAVGWVALPDIPLDPAGAPEAALLKHAPPWLHPVWHNRNWQVWRVLGAPSIASPPASLVRLDSSTVVLNFSAEGTSTVRVRAAPLWRITTGTGCLSTDRQGWLEVTGKPGRLVLSTGVPGTGDPDACPQPTRE